MTDLPDVTQAYITAYNGMDVEGMSMSFSDTVSFRNISAGQELTFSGASLFRVEDGKIVSIVDES